MALAAMYQRIPYDMLSQVRTKKPQSYAIYKLPHTGDEDRRGANSGPRTVAMASAKWEARAFASNIDFEKALETVERANNEPRTLKIKLTFADGCHLLLVRTVNDDPSSLKCTEKYDPNGTFQSKTQGAKERFEHTEGERRKKTLVDENGHLINRRRDEKGDALNNTFKKVVDPVGKDGFSFTPVSYLSYQVDSNRNFPGVRPGLRETNKEAHQFLSKQENQGF